MGAIADLATMAATRITGGRLDNPPDWLRMLLGGGRQTASGVDVDEDVALTYSALWAAVDIIAGAVGMLPCHLYRRLDRGRKRASDHPAYRLLHDRPNPYMDAAVFRETIQGHALTWGNGYAEIERDGAARPINLWPLLPNRTEPKLSPDKKLYFEVTLPNGGTAVLPAENVLHLRGLGWDGLKGYSVVGYHRESIGLGLATQRYGARFFANGARPGGVLEHPGEMKETARKNFIESWDQMHKGLDHSHRVAILEEGMKWHEIGIPPDDAQLIESQKFGIGNIARIFRVPPHMLAELDRATFSNIEDQGLEFVVYCLGRWLKKWEFESTYKLVAEADQSSYYAEFLTDAMLRGNAKTRAEMYEIYRRIGVYSKNDVRERENLNAIEGGDDYTSLAELQASKGQAVTGTDSPKPDKAAAQAVAMSLVGTLADPIARIRRKEDNDARRALKRGGEAFGEWSRSYLVSAAETFREAVLPATEGAARAIAAAAGFPANAWLDVCARACAAAAAERHLLAMKRDFGLLAGNADDEAREDDSAGDGADGEALALARHLLLIIAN